MLGRRYLRTKVLQFLYAQHISNDHPGMVESNLMHNIEQIFNIYIYILSILLGLKNSKNRFNINLNKNKLLIILSLNRDLRKSLDKISSSLWKDYEKDLLFFVKKLPNIPIYIRYCSIKNKSFKDDKNFILSFYAKYVAISETFYECVEDNDLVYVNDLYIAHVMVYKTLNSIHSSICHNFKFYDRKKEIDSKKFVQSLFRKTIFNKKELNRLIRNTSINWKLERISTIDLIILQMSICEFLYFPTIPPLVTISEYIEITKIYSTNKSKIFINGILDKLLKL